MPPTLPVSSRPLRTFPATWVVAACAAAWATPAGGQTAVAPVRYEVAFPNRAHHEAEVAIRYTDLQPGPLELRMSRTSPGRYALHEFAKNVYSFRATDGEGRLLPVHRPDPHQWTVSDHGGEVVVTYTLYADRADGTYAAVDESHAHLNAPATFMWARDLFERPVELTVRVPEGSGWKVATQLAPTTDPHVFAAPSHHYFLDSPVEVSDFDLREWRVGDQTVRVALHHRGTDAEVDRYAEHTRAIVEAERAVYGELPRFDFGTYTFLACYLPWASGDGMEHRNSTILTSSASLESNMVGLLGTVAHEFFHAWSIERIRPASLEPFDFEAANMSRELWFGEGFTSYYDDVALVRGGVIDPGDFARRAGGSVDVVVNSPGRRFFSPVEMSMQAPFVDAAVSIDPVNRANTFISYYTWGAALGLALDLTLRTRFEDLGLDEFMRAVWARHGVPELPYTVEDLETVLAQVTGDRVFAADFFDRFIRGGEVPDYEALLAHAGMVLRPSAPSRAILARVPLVPTEGGLRVTGSTLLGSPLYEAGLDRDDVVHAVAGVAMEGEGALARALRGRSPGEVVEVDYMSRGERRTVAVRLQADPSLEAVLVEEAGGRPAAAQVALRRAWLGG